MLFIIPDLDTKLAEDDGIYIRTAGFWDVTPCGTCKKRRFVGMYRLHRHPHWWWRLCVPLKLRFLHEPHTVTTHKTAFFIATAAKTSNLMNRYTLPHIACSRIDFNRTEDYGISGSEPSSNCSLHCDRLTLIKGFMTAMRNHAFPRWLLAE
jgi:hypothetical protein